MKQMTRISESVRKDIPKEIPKMVVLQTKTDIDINPAKIQGSSRFNSLPLQERNIEKRLSAGDPSIQG